jgi:hypothetical protein
MNITAGISILNSGCEGLYTGTRPAVTDNRPERGQFWVFRELLPLSLRQQGDTGSLQTDVPDPFLRLSQDVFM